LHISHLALEHLALDEVWWLVSPQNPLKPEAGMAPFAARLEGARKLAAGQGEGDSEGKGRIRATGIEARLGTRYTVDTLRALTRGPDLGLSAAITRALALRRRDPQPRTRAVVALPRCRILTAAVFLARRCSHSWRLRSMGSPRQRSMPPPERPRFRAAGWW